jgi:plastocyanin
MPRKYLFVAVVSALVAALAVPLALARSSGGATVKVFAHERYVINKSSSELLGFTPGTVTVTSGSTLTFTYGNKQMDPHTLTIVPKARLPKTPPQIDQCAVCRQYATPHLKNPKAPPGPGNPIVHFVLDKGSPGFDTVGDSLAIEPSPGHKSITVQVSAPAGTTLYFVCAVHPWMQGKIVVK